MTPDPVHVAVSGFSWTTAFVGLLNVLVAGALVAWIKGRPKMRELEKTADEKLRDDLLTRVTKLEIRLEEERAQHDASMSVMRHRLNNSDQCLDALLMLLETSPEKVTEAVAIVKTMRERQRIAEALEKAAIHAAKISVTAEQPPA